jgi:hypothetical protein
MPEFRRQVCLAIEAGAVLGVGRHLCRKHFQGVVAGEVWVLGEINLAHTARPKQAHDPEARESLTAAQRHVG